MLSALCCMLHRPYHFPNSRYCIGTHDCASAAIHRPAQPHADSDDLLFSHETLDNTDQNGGHTVRPQPLPVGMRDASAAAARQQQQVTHVVPTHLRNGRSKSMAGSGGGAGAAGRTLSRNGAMQVCAHDRLTLSTSSQHVAIDQFACSLFS